MSSIVVPTGFQPCAPWAGIEQFVCNEKTPCGDKPCPDGYVSPTTDEEYLEIATSTLFQLTGSRFTSCEIEISPRPICGCQLTDCGTCGVYPFVDLGSKVIHVVDVFVGGIEIPKTTWKVDDHRYLVRLGDTNGNNPGWPRNNRIDVLHPNPGSMRIRFLSGHELPAGAAQAAVALACALKISGNQTAVASMRQQTATSVNTRGFSATTEGILKGLRTGKSGIMMVDVFLATWLEKTENERGDKINGRSAVWSPEVAAARHIRTTQYEA